LSGASSTKTSTFLFTQTNNQTFTFPNITAGGNNDQIVILQQTQTMTNKTLTTPVIQSLYPVTAGTNLLTMPTVVSADNLVSRTSTDILSNKILLTTNSYFADTSDNTKKIQFTCGTGVGTGSILILNSTISGASTTRTISFPDITDTVVTLTETQTLTNKTLTTPIISSIVNGTGTLTLPLNTNDTLLGTNTTNSITNKSLLTDTCFFIDPTINSKKIGFSCSSATTGTTMLLTSAVSVNRTLNFPDTSDTIVTQAFAQTLTNKNIVGLTNTVGATQLQTATNAVVISGSSVPSAGQTLIATNSTTASWQTIALSALEKTATNAVLTTSSTFVIIPGATGNMTLTFPINGTYIVTFSGYSTVTNTTLVAKICLYSTLSSITSQIVVSERDFSVRSPVQMLSFNVHTQTLITASAGDSISAYFATTAGSFTMNNRSLLLHRVG
jgi:galactitol-specific phosphotransferase system IIB component